ncbi:MAG: AraC family transcriptional regulator [Piscinibacter sp.]|uniref:AraC family transcriptional regulator n=1 Tax=Piscinibacter sp. TaxID=1903157 RepID=UPI001B4E863F|nr:AraC family transcriptional regulator [Piscinibacter sp.]MBP5990785.1 AraC family transcriptional regulator [Piscinibacter sp.]MBP6028195.1 AraC family transcriptional regulator [Piscinibacter sp.]
MARILQHESRDVDDQAKALNDWQQSYEQLGCGRFRGSAWQLVMDQGVLLRESTNRPLAEHITPPKDHLVLALPVTVEPGSVFSGRPMERDSLMVLSDREQYDVISAGALDLIGLSVHSDTVAATLAPSKIEWLERAERERSLELPPDVAASIRQVLLAVCAGAERKIDSLAEPANETTLLAATLTQAVMLAMRGNDAERASSIPRRADSRLRVVKRAIEFMRANLVNDIGIPEICAAAFASRRTLQYCFEEFMHTTPQAHLRALRLNEARRALKLRADQPITEVASLLGFSSASHFTRHYKLMFDELPSQTLKYNGCGPFGV